MITDAYSKQIMGYELRPDLESASTQKALMIALKHRDYPGQPLIHHSDRGLQYCSMRYVETLRQHGISVSMTENGDSYENAVAECVNGILKEEFDLGDLPGNLWENRKLARKSIEIYNRLRPHLSCSMLTPVQMHAQKQLKIKTWRNEKASRNMVIS